jgi:O-antigen ligase
MWEELLSMVQNPLLGFGFESFWLGRRADIIEQHWGIDKQAHNGYLDMYLNLGSIGVFLSLAYILAGFKKTYRSLFVDYPSAILRLCFLVVFVLFNWTENGFHLQNPMWLLLLLSIMDSLAPDSAESEIPEVSSRVSSAAEQGAT